LELKKLTKDNIYHPLSHHRFSSNLHLKVDGKRERERERELDWGQNLNFLVNVIKIKTANLNQPPVQLRSQRATFFIFLQRQESYRAWFAAFHSPLNWLLIRHLVQALKQKKPQIKQKRQRYGAQLLMKIKPRKAEDSWWKLEQKETTKAAAITVAIPAATPVKTLSTQPW